MSKNLDKSLIVGLDIGTSKVAVIIGEVLPDSTINVVGVGDHPSRGMDKGGVNDLDSIVKSIQRALDQAELMADCKVTSVYLSISGMHIACQNENGMVSINNDEVTQEDVDKVIETAKAVKFPQDRKLLHAFPQDFSIDVQDFIKSPVGMSGMRMESRVHIITCANDMKKNIEKCVERSGLKVDGIVFSGIASAEAVLTDDEKELGVCLVDIGGGTTDITVYINGSLRFSSVIGCAGNQVTNDMARVLRTPLSHAEQLKVQYARAIITDEMTDESIDVASVGGRPARIAMRHTLTEIVEPRYEHIFRLVLDELNKNGLGDSRNIASGIVLTGGSSSIEGIGELAESVFEMPVRVATPIPVKGLVDFVNHPKYSTGIGLLRYGAKNMLDIPQKQGARKFLNQLKSWIKGEF